MLFKFAKKSNILQDAYLALSTAIHPAITHNTGKIGLLKAALFLAAIENLEGAYFEFGVFEGTSLKAAAKIQRTLSANAKDEFASLTSKRYFYGFDSFESGFKYISPEEAHPTYSEGNFTSSYERCKRRFRYFPEVSLIKGYFEDSIQGKTPDIITPGQKCAIAFIDCDLKNPALIALQFLRPILQPGSIIILDDAYAYKGNPRLGVYGAWQEFLTENSNIKVREYLNFGVSGKSYIIWSI